MDKPRDMSIDVSKDRARVSREYFSSPNIKLPIPKKFDGEPLYAKEFLSSLLTYFEFNNL